MAVQLQVLFTIMLLVFSLITQSKEFALKDMQGLMHRLPD